MRSSVFLLVVIMLSAVGCGTTDRTVTANPHYKLGEPYKIAGRWYAPREDKRYDRVGVASWYGKDFHGRLTANGEIFDMNRLSAAHPTLPLPSMVEVRNLENGRRAIVRVNDRGPFAEDRLIDLSRAAARALGFEGQGLARVRVRYVGPASLEKKAAKPGSKQKTAHKTTAPETALRQPPAGPSSGGDEIGALLAALETSEYSTPPGPVGAVAPETVSFKGPPQTAMRLTDTRSAGPYRIDVADLSIFDDLQSVRHNLSVHGPVTIKREEEPDADPVYRVRLGPFESLSDAEQRLQALRSAGYVGAAISLDGS